MTNDEDGGGSLPVVDDVTVAEAGGGHASDLHVAGVLLAAGESDRFGSGNKLLATLDGEPLVRHAARTLTDADLGTVVAVVGHEADRVREPLEDLPVTVVENPDHARGQATSVREGIRAVHDANAAVFALGDMPRVDPRSVDLLVDAFAAGLGDPIAAAHEGRRGNPVLFGGRSFDDLADVDGDTGGRRLLLEGAESALVETGDPGVRVDVDSPADIDRLRAE